MTNNEEIRDMLKRGYTVWQICKITGCEEEYVKKIEEDMVNGI